ncbi:hypothetical protein RM697_11530 [Ichthyenterobacterium sp. W332]|uniref:Uncharacterized protein n=1 Tax=Microcosmobacter mediterraneus TaxID=3075607 RepID=A0ABU2YN20_9FLAO|nr:hypothetical protein [Ichthyenterobacterium sp. W332]MDT0559286.1 hypothetical protein [Ichthyenterobacterium sp. W332]
MNKYYFVLSLILLLCTPNINAQTELKTKANTTKVRLFSSNNLLPIKLKYSRKNVKKVTNDTTYMESELSYKTADSAWKSLPIKLKVRGNFRKKACYFTPLKLKIKKSDAKTTLFKGEKKLKLVLPCKKEKAMNDNVVKEYLAYKIYEIISPIHFKTRLLDIEYEDVKKKKSDFHNIKGFVIEDDESVAKRFEGNVVNRSIYPNGQDAFEALKTELFQFMIGNTDFSATYQHNVKMMVIDKKYVPVPYDFDMSGLVNCSYAVVSDSRSYKLPITSVRERLFLGYKRDAEVFNTVRQLFKAKKAEVLTMLQDHEIFFKNETAFKVTKEYIVEFYKILENEAKFKKYILDAARNM